MLDLNCSLINNQGNFEGFSCLSSSFVQLTCQQINIGQKVAEIQSILMACT